MGKGTQRDQLVAKAAEIFQARGYAATGLREIAVEAGIPQGSLTNHFRSKQGLGLAALELYLARLEAVMAATLADAARPPAARLAAYFDRIEALVAAAEYRRGCLVVDLAAEIPSQSEAIRTRLGEIIARQRAAFEAVLALLPAAPDAPPPAARAGFLLAAWQGTLLQMKVERSAAPLRRFRLMLRHFCPPEGAA